MRNNHLSLLLSLWSFNQEPLQPQRRKQQITNWSHKTRNVPLTLLMNRELFIVFFSSREKFRFIWKMIFQQTSFSAENVTNSCISQFFKLNWYWFKYKCVMSTVFRNSVNLSSLTKFDLPEPCTHHNIVVYLTNLHCKKTKMGTCCSNGHVGMLAKDLDANGMFKVKWIYVQF